MFCLHFFEDLLDGRHENLGKYQAGKRDKEIYRGVCHQGTTVNFKFYHQWHTYLY